MKKFMLLAILSLFAFAASAQEKNERIPYDWEAARNFTVQTQKPLMIKADRKFEYYDPTTHQYLNVEKFRKKYGSKTVKKLYFENRRKSAGYTTNHQNYRWRLNPVNAVVGGSMIGVSLATVLVCNVQDMDPNTIEIINYAGAGVALVGTIVLISGLHKEYVPGKGLAVSNNLYLDSPAGLSLAIAF